MYSSVVLDHFQRPRNIGDLPDADATGEAGNPVNGNSMVIQVKIAENRVTEARFRAYGCPATLASGSMATVWLTGKALEEAVAIEDDTIAAVLNGLPPTKRHCSVLAADAVRACLAMYSEKEQRSRGAENQ
ncbi:MAG: iron-sulfur cluster assembly scaffold protein [candidate division Zixibacteria bacterium]|nr:iron-sulfur cluster assembly scaffold protein [candidate division Zixibacteria bacterium]